MATTPTMIQAIKAIQAYPSLALRPIRIKITNFRNRHMKQVRFLHQVFMAMAVSLALGSCTSDELSEMEPINQDARRTMKMEFIGDVVGFDQQSSSNAKVQTRATSSSWKDGDKIYITFYNGSAIVPGEATYSSSSGWSVSYDDNLATGSSLKCEARYFVNATISSSSLVSLNSNSEIYEDLNATYSYSDGSLTVTAILSPKTGRIRFTGKAEEKIYTTGITVYTTFSPATNTFSTSNAMITSTVASSGSTPYIYGFFTDNDRSLGLVGSDNAFTRTCTSGMFNTGESGYMAIPSESSHNNWRSGLYVKASGVEFKMIPVAGHTDGFFMIAETETTEALYESVNGTSSTSQFPVSNVYVSNITSFIEKLNNETKLSFSLPSASQWRYAAKGGNKTQGYTYAGSNTPGDVAWYSANCSSKQKVKTKAPNELGIYDMSGNVGEFVSDYKNASSHYNYVYGGCYKSASSYIKNTSSTYSYYDAWCQAGYNGGSYSDGGAGFRLILTCK